MNEPRFRDDEMDRFVVRCPGNGSHHLALVGKRDAERTSETIVRCPAQTRFKDWVLQLRGGRNTIEITVF